MKQVGFLGPMGTFSHEAVLKYIAGRQDFEHVPFHSIPDLMLAVSNGSSHEAVLPIENSLEGAVNVTLDMFAMDLDIKIKKELALCIHENLLVRPGTEPQDIQVILSHVQPLGQCRRYLETHFRDAQMQSVGSTTAAAEAVLKGDGSTAAIGSSVAAELYGLNILARDIQDEENNSTRFVVIAKQDSEFAERSKSSIIFSVDHAPGRLNQILGIFNLWDINMTRIESRPSKRKLGEYIFFVDIDGHREQPDVMDALKMVERKTAFYRFLGSYPCL